LLAQYKSGHISSNRYLARVRQAREQWEHELRCGLGRRAQGYCPVVPLTENAKQAL
jgi:hypothetical protein